jgi:opacity protein-like surface antigen
MFMKSYIILFTFFSSRAVSSVTAQTQKKSSNYEVGAALGAFVYQGDLAQGRYGSWRTAKPGIILHGSRKLNSTLAVRLNATLASLKGDEAKFNTPAYRKQRSFNFSTPLIELSPQIVWSPWGWDEVGARISPYAFAGVSLAYLRVRRDYSGFNASHFTLEENLPARIAQDMQRRTPTLLPAIPFGAGVRYAVSPSIVINGEFNYRHTFSDYIDGFSIAANPKLKDHYYSVSAGVIYRFGKKNAWDCPPVKK